MIALRQSTQGVSGSFLVGADDGSDYWCKATNNPASPRVPVNEQIVGRLGQLVGVAVAEPMLVRLDAIVGWEFRPGRLVEPGWAHGSKALVGALETRALEHRGDDDNRVRHAGFYGLMDWMHGGDQQWLYATQERNAYYSHDHGHYFPGGPDWTSASLATAVAAPQRLAVDPAKLDHNEVERLAATIEATTLEDLENVMSKIPVSWAVSDQELADLAAFISTRSAPTAERLRALVP